ncbi:hypothetical protein AC1031_016033 [Aphanomyces cochlioides]|nr:hypothetical protein AC1031_016033 [Aphanomyces cochlioides]
MVATTRARGKKKQEEKPCDFEVPHARATPFCAIPPKVVNAMIFAGANDGQPVGSNLSIVRVADVHSVAWQIYEEWASSLGDKDPLVRVHFAPPNELRQTLVCPPLKGWSMAYCTKQTTLYITSLQR